MSICALLEPKKKREPAEATHRRADHFAKATGRRGQPSRNDPSVSNIQILSKMAQYTKTKNRLLVMNAATFRGGLF